MTSTLRYFFRVFCAVNIVFTWDVQAATIRVVRDWHGDLVENPYSSGSADANETFCRSVNGFCREDYPNKHDKCRYCQCDRFRTTYLEHKSDCENTVTVKKGCIIQFDKANELYVNVLDVSRKGEQKLALPGLVKHNHMKKCDVSNVQQMTANGYRNITHIFRIDKVYDDKKLMKLKWGDMGQSYHGRLYRMTVTCNMEKHESGDPKEKYTMDQCIALKTVGTIQVNYPGLPPPSQSSTSSLTTEGPSTTTAPSTTAAPSTTTAPATSSSTAQIQTSTTPSATTDVKSTQQQATPTTPSTTTEVRSTQQQSTSTTSSTATQVARSTTQIETPTTTVGQVETSTLEIRTSDSPLTTTTEQVESATSQEEKKVPPNNEKRTSKDGGGAVIYLSTAIAIVIVIFGIGLLYFLRTKIRKKIESLRSGIKSGDQTSDLKKEQPVYATPENIAMNDVDNVYEGVYDGDYTKFGMKRTKSEGFENGIFGSDVNKNVYSSLEGPRSDLEANYQPLVFPGTKPSQYYEDPDKQQIYDESDSAYLTVLPDQQQKQPVYSVWEDGRQSTQPFDSDYVVVLPSGNSSEDRNLNKDDHYYAACMY